MLAPMASQRTAHCCAGHGAQLVAECPGEQLDLLRRRGLGGAHEEPVGEGRVAGLKLRERDPCQDAPVEQPAVGATHPHQGSIAQPVA